MFAHPTQYVTCSHSHAAIRTIFDNIEQYATTILCKKSQKCLYGQVKDNLLNKTLSLSLSQSQSHSTDIYLYKLDITCIFVFAKYEVILTALSLDSWHNVRYICILLRNHCKFISVTIFTYKKGLFINTVAFQLN